MTRHNDYQHQLDQARKAGLNAREINSALTGQPASGDTPVHADANGFVWTIDERGHRTCKPADATEE